MHWMAPAAALGTGIDNTAVIITTGAYNAADPLGNTEVFAVSSNDGGQNFQRSLILTSDEDGVGSGVATGGDIVAGSVHASLAYFGERTSPVAGSVSLPIYVVWQNILFGTREWWWTRIVVGEDGFISQTTPPQKLPAWVPRQPGVHVSIFGHRIRGEERVSIAWSERGDAASPATCTTSVAEQPISWYASTTTNLGGDWGCFYGNEYVPPPPAPQNPLFVGCDGSQQRTLIKSATNWRPCIRAHATSPILNNDRPEVAVSAPADPDGNGVEELDFDRYFYFALSEPRSSTNSQAKVCVYRTGSLEVPLVGAPPQDHVELLPLGCTPTKDAQARNIDASWSQALAVAQASQVGAGPRVEVTHRVHGTFGVRQQVMTLMHETYPGNTPKPGLSQVSGADAPHDVGSWGLYSGLMVYEKCDPENPSCPDETNFSPDSDVPFAAAWTDTQRSLSPRVNDARVRAFEWEQ